VATQWPRFVGNDDVKIDSWETVNSGWSGVDVAVRSWGLYKCLFED
jgi:hypothetical protein